MLKEKPDVPDYDIGLFHSLTGEDITEGLYDKAYSLKVFASHIHEITSLKPGEEVTLCYGGGLVTVHCFPADNIKDDPNWYQFKFELKHDTIWVGNRWGAFGAYGKLWARYVNLEVKDDKSE